MCPANLSYKKDDLYNLGFSYFQKIGPANWRRLENYFPDLKTAWLASRSELEQAGLSPQLTADFIKWRPSCDREKIIQELKRYNINCVTWHDPDYPALLLEISSPPPVLYYQGQLPGIAKNRLAVVGSREPSAYSDKIIKEIITPVARAGVAIVSGLALGVDALAHQAALAARSQTIAILGSGLAPQNIYPAANRGLAAEIVRAGGTLISEFPPSTPPYKQNFPQRNRIISGLCQAALVVEAQQKSGALITARYALEQNREVLAVPGNIFSAWSDGPNQLIQAGAKSITRAENILETFNITSDLPANLPASRREISAKYCPEDDTTRVIYNLIKGAHERAETITADEIGRLSQLDTATINSTLSILEIAGIAKKTESGYDLN
jgi:DNA processing protein